MSVRGNYSLLAHITYGCEKGTLHRKRFQSSNVGNLHVKIYHTRQMIHCLRFWLLPSPIPIVSHILGKLVYTITTVPFALSIGSIIATDLNVKLTKFHKKNLLSTYNSWFPSLDRLDRNLNNLLLKICFSNVTVTLMNLVKSCITSLI